jgi:PncC family amidohydrolase
MRTSGLAESVLAEGLERVLDPALGVVLQYRPSLVGVELRFTAEGPGADLRLARALEAVEAEVAPWRYGGADDSLASAALDACAARGWKLGTAESCTGGLVGAWLTEIPGSSAVYAGGVVAYANALKTTLLDVSPQLLEMHGAVSEPVARAMAEGALQATDADLSVSITGVAGPGGGTASRPVGTVCFATARRGARPGARAHGFPATGRPCASAQRATRFAWCGRGPSRVRAPRDAPRRRRISRTNLPRCPYGTGNCELQSTGTRRPGPHPKECHR